MTTRYHVPEDECRKLTMRPFYCGHTWDELLRSAEMTADAWGQAYIVVSKGTQERAGGRIFVSSLPESPWISPTVLLATIES